MAAAAANPIPIYVKAFTGEMFELTIDPLRGKEAAKRALHAAYPNEFPRVSKIDFLPLDHPFQNIQQGDILSVIHREPPLVTLLNCDREDWQNEDDVDGAFYTFEIDRENGLEIRDMYHYGVGFRRYSQDEIDAYRMDDTKPNFLLYISYNPEISPDYMVPSIDRQLVRFHLVSRYHPRAQGLTDEQYFSQMEFSMEYGPTEGRRRDIRQVEFRLKPETVHKLIEILNRYNKRCVSTHGGQRRALGKRSSSKRSSSKRSSKRREMKKRVVRKSKKTQKRRHTKLIL